MARLRLITQMSMRFIFIFLFLQSSVIVNAQNFVLSGRISDKQESLPFATILVKGTSNVTNSNAEGHYSLKLQAGTYEIIYQYVGYAKHTETVVIHGNTTLNVQLHTDGIALKEVDITAGEDPAVAIIRKAIKKRRFYNTQVSSYTCKAYIKGLQKIKSMPKNILGLLKIFGGQASDTNDIKGVIYLSESESQYYFKRPDHKEIMYSSKVSGDNRSFSFNKLSDMKLNLYQNLIELGSLSARPLVSPLHDNAFLFYKYYLQGTYVEDGHTIHKIKVVPKNSTDPCFAGLIYIQDDAWRLTSVDLMLTKEMKIEFVDTVRIKQLFSPVKEDEIWMPVSLNYSFEFKVFGFQGSGYFNANISEYELYPTMEKKFFKNELLVVQEGSNKKDSAYWNAHRTVPLTDEEKLDYRRKDSIVKIRETDRYKDSTDKVSNKFKFNDLLFGYTYSKTKDKFSVSLPGLITYGVQYNTVEGLNLSYRFGISKSYEDFRQYNISGRARYGFANKLWGGELSYYYYLNAIKRTRIGCTVKSIVEQFNKEEPIHPLVNSLYTLFYNENHMKLFKETGGNLLYSSEVLNGLFTTVNASYMQRDPLVNSTDLLLVDDKKKKFTSNDPQDLQNENPAFVSNQAFVAEIDLLIRFNQKYYTVPGQKIIAGSRYPRLNINYKKAIPLAGASVNYDLLSAGVKDGVRLGMLGVFRYKINAGVFLNTKNMYFMDYKHFLGNQTIFNTHDYLEGYRLLPYYTYSADKWYTELHAEHHFRGILFSRIPLLKKTKVQEVVAAHFLSNNNLNQYYEINFGLERIFNVIRVDYILGYGPGNVFRQGFTIGISNTF